MTWQTRLQQASFAGVPFRFDYVTDENGQRISIHNPITAPPTTRALGKTVRRLIISGYFIGNDPHLDADRLRTAANNGKTDTLIHPYFGVIQCRITQLTLRDEKAAGGIVYFTAQFIESREAEGLIALPAPRENAEVSADELREHVQQILGYHGGATADDIANFTAAQSGALNTTRKLASREVITTTQIANDFTARQTLAKAYNLYNKTKNATPDNILTLANAANIVSDLTTATADIDDIINFIAENGGDIATTISGKINRLTTTAAIGSAATTIAGGIAQIFPDRQTAIAAQDDIANAAATENTNADSDEIAIAITKTAAAISEVFDSELPSLPQLRQVNTQNKNAATLLTEINGTLNDGDIDSLMRQNQIAHPLLLPPSVEITQ